jgi:hypothetical protein
MENNLFFRTKVLLVGMGSEAMKEKQMALQIK